MADQKDQAKEDLGPEEKEQAWASHQNHKEKRTDVGLLRERILEVEMQESYLDYAMSVIVARALPDVRDGLKPVHRRVLYAMWETGLKAAAKYRKCAAVVGEVLKSYHPHGDIAVYDTLVRMAQDFNMRLPLVDGQGNFGSMDGDAAAAMRYTECRMSPIAEELLFDIEKETVDFTPNYDGTKNEPKVMPAKLPNLLLNGSMGIAVGMATNIPPHNLGELCDAIVYLIDHPDCTIEELMQYIKGPDFPTGAEIYGLEQIKTAYTFGKGAIVMRSVASIEESKRGFRIIISEIPYQVNKSELISKIADLIKEKKIDGVSDLRDESDRKEKVRIVIELKTNAYPKKVLNRLYELTAMQTSFYTNMLALVDGIQPRILTLKNILEEYLKNRQKVIRRRLEFDLTRAKERAHILEGLKIALQSIDEVISTIKKSQSRDDAQKALVKKFTLTDIQANAILEMRLSSLAALERQKVEDEHTEKLKLIKGLEEILQSESKILMLIKDDLKELKEKYRCERRTKIYAESLERFKAEDLIPSEQVIIILTRGNYIKRMPVSSYRSQIRGGKGVLGMETKEEDMIEHLVVANSHDDIYFFTDRGRIFHTKVYEIPQVSRISKGQAIVNILQISPEEKVTAMITVSSKDLKTYKYILLATSKGLVKRTAFSLYEKVRKSGITAIKLNSEDRLRWVKVTTGEDLIFQVSAKGQSILYNESDIRPMGRTAAGVRGIHLKTNDYVVATDVLTQEMRLKADTLVVTEKGFGKRTPLDFFKIQLRGGMGLRAANVTDRTGLIVGARVVVGEDHDLILASYKGQMIRMAVSSVKKLQRDTQGVILFRFNPGDRVTSVTVISKDKEEKLIVSEPPPSLPPPPSSPTPPLESPTTSALPKKLPEKLSETIEPEAGAIPDWAKVHSDEVAKNSKATSKSQPSVKLKLQPPEETNYWGKN